MIQAADIFEVVDRIRQAFAPRQIVLFGPCASGQPSVESDVDLLVITGYLGTPHRKAARITTALGSLPFSMDLLVRHPAEFAKRVRLNDQLLKEIVEK